MPLCLIVAAAIGFPVPIPIRIFAIAGRNAVAPILGVLVHVLQHLVTHRLLLLRPVDEDERDAPECVTYQVVEKENDLVREEITCHLNAWIYTFIVSFLVGRELAFYPQEP